MADEFGLDVCVCYICSHIQTAVNPEEDNAAVVAYWQLGRLPIEESVLSNVLAQIIHVRRHVRGMYMAEYIDMRSTVADLASTADPGS